MPRRSRSDTSPRLIAVDLDGTLLDVSGVPHVADVAALRKCHDEGIIVTIATGRLYSGTRAAAQAIGVRGLVACADGSHIVHAPTHATRTHRGVAGEDALALKSMLDEEELASFLFVHDTIVYDDAGELFAPYVRTWSEDMRQTRCVYEHEYWAAETGVTAVVSLGEEENIRRTAEWVRARGTSMQVAVFPLRRISSTMWAMIVRAHGSTKGLAVTQIAEHHGLSIEECVTVGDWMNDVSMLSVSGRSFAMGQAPDEVKEAATDVLEETHHTGSGIARAVELAFGIRV